MSEYRQTSFLVDEVRLPDTFDPRVSGTDFDHAVANFFVTGEPIPVFITDPSKTTDDPQAYSPVPNLTEFHINGDPPQTMKQRVQGFANRIIRRPGRTTFEDKVVNEKIPTRPARTPKPVPIFQVPLPLTPRSQLVFSPAS